MRFVSVLYHDVFPDGGYDYGRIGESATRYHVAAGAFSRQLDLIQATGLVALGAEAVEQAIEDREPGAGSSEQGVLISFDDGWNGAISGAARILSERRVPAFFFITTGFIGKRHFASAAAIRALDPRLFTVGSHTVSHKMLSSLPAAAIRAEVADSKRQLEDLLGRPVTALSAPGGAVNRRVAAIVRDAGYTTLFTSSIAINPTRGGMFDIARLGVLRTTSDATFRRWLGFGLGRERFRKALLGVPKRLLGMRAYSNLRRTILGERAGVDHVFEP